MLGLEKMSPGRLMIHANLSLTSEGRRRYPPSHFTFNQQPKYLIYLIACSCLYESLSRPLNVIFLVFGLRIPNGIDLSNASKYNEFCFGPSLVVHPSVQRIAQDSSDRISRMEHSSPVLRCYNHMSVKDRSNLDAGERCVLLSWWTSR